MSGDWGKVDLKADRSDRAYSGDDSGGAFRFFMIQLCLVAAIVGGVCLYLGKDNVLALFESQWADQAKELEPLWVKLGVEPLPPQALVNTAIGYKLTSLNREPCDWQILRPLTKDLEANGHRRDAANMLIGYSRNCQASDVALYNAANILLDLADIDAALKVSDELVQMSNHIGEFHFTRARILQRASRFKDAIDEYYSMIALTDDAQRLNSLSFTGIAESQAALGKFCDAVEPLQTWLAIDPENRDTPQLRTMMDGYADKGNCRIDHASGSDRFPVSNNNVIFVRAEINGVRGRFIVDTGASYVTLTPAFARKAGFQLEDDFPVAMQTANGVSWAQRATSSKMQVGKVGARNVATIILKDGAKALGPGLDGLLGRSFLSRFDVTISSREWRITSKR